jgi:hypothetical protein
MKQLIFTAFLFSLPTFSIAMDCIPQLREIASINSQLLEVLGTSIEIPTQSDEPMTFLLSTEFPNVVTMETLQRLHSFGEKLTIPLTTAFYDASKNSYRFIATGTSKNISAFLAKIANAKEFEGSSTKVLEILDEQHSLPLKALTQFNSVICTAEVSGEEALEEMGRILKTADPHSVTLVNFVRGGGMAWAVPATILRSLMPEGRNPDFDKFLRQVKRADVAAKKTETYFFFTYDQFSILQQMVAEKSLSQVLPSLTQKSTIEKDEGSANEVKPKQKTLATRAARAAKPVAHVTQTQDTIRSVGIGSMSAGYKKFMPGGEEELTAKNPGVRIDANGKTVAVLLSAEAILKASMGEAFAIYKQVAGLESRETVPPMVNILLRSYKISKGKIPNPESIVSISKLLGAERIYGRKANPRNRFGHLRVPYFGVGPNLDENEKEKAIAKRDYLLLLPVP